jgi:hypothetical protein
MKAKSFRSRRRPTPSAARPAPKTFASIKAVDLGLPRMYWNL